MENILSEQEMDALLEPDEASLAMAEEEVKQNVRAYDLNYSSHRINGWHKQLSLVDEKLIRSLSQSLLGLLRRPCEVVNGGIRMLRFGDYLDGLESPTGLHSYRLESGLGVLIVVLDAPFVFSLVEALFGGSGRKHAISSRGFTRTEQAVSALVLEKIITSLHSAWPELAAQQLELIDSAHNPQACSTLAVNDVVMIRRYQVSYTGGSGELQLVLPSAQVEALFQTSDESNLQSTAQGASDLPRRVLRFNTTVAGRVRGVSLSLGDLLQLRCGDVLPIESPEIVDVTINGVAKFQARVGEREGRVGLSILEKVENNSQ